MEPRDIAEQERNVPDPALQEELDRSIVRAGTYVQMSGRVERREGDPDPSGPVIVDVGDVVDNGNAVVADDDIGEIPDIGTLLHEDDEEEEEDEVEEDEAEEDDDEVVDLSPRIIVDDYEDDYCDEEEEDEDEEDEDDYCDEEEEDEDEEDEDDASPERPTVSIASPHKFVVIPADPEFGMPMVSYSCDCGFNEKRCPCGNHLCARMRLITCPSCGSPLSEGHNLLEKPAPVPKKSLEEIVGNLVAKIIRENPRMPGLDGMILQKSSRNGLSGIWVGGVEPEKYEEYIIENFTGAAIRTPPAPAGSLTPTEAASAAAVEPAIPEPEAQPHVTPVADDPPAQEENIPYEVSRTVQTRVTGFRMDTEFGNGDIHYSTIVEIAGESSDFDSFFDGVKDYIIDTCDYDNVNFLERGEIEVDEEEFLETTSRSWGVMRDNLAAFLERHPEITFNEE